MVETKRKRLSSLLAQDLVGFEKRKEAISKEKKDKKKGEEFMKFMLEKKKRDYEFILRDIEEDLKKMKRQIDSKYMVSEKPYLEDRFIARTQEKIEVDECIVLLCDNLGIKPPMPKKETPNLEPFMEEYNKAFPTKNALFKEKPTNTFKKWLKTEKGIEM